MQTDAPIGIFDSGVGGLTVAKEVSARLPQEHIVYVGDEVHIPYGDRPPEKIRSYALGITRFLVEKCQAKMVIMACNMSSALALEPARQMFPDVPILGVIEAGSRAAARISADGRVGVLATQGTVNTGVYTRVLSRLISGADVHEQACPTFVPLIESGRADSAEALEAVAEYTWPLTLGGYRTVILGCTHYPFLADAIGRALGPDATLIDPAEETVLEAQEILSNMGILNPPHVESVQRYLTTARPDQFASLGGRFIRRSLDQVEQIRWGIDLGAIEWLEKTVEQTTRSAR
jgi:glutamate racemase